MENYTVKCYQQQEKYMIDVYESDRLTKAFTTEYRLIGSFKKNNQEHLMVGDNYGIKKIINIETEEIYMTHCDDKYRYLTSHKISPDGNTMAILICYPACAGELYKFYDFTDLSKGWPELKIKNNLSFFAIDQCECFWDNDNTFQIHTKDDELLLDKIEILERKNNKMFLINVWKSEKQIKLEDEYDRTILEMNNIINNNMLCNQLKKELSGLQNIYSLFECSNFVNPFYSVIITNYNLKDEDFPDYQKKRCCLSWNNSKYITLENYDNTYLKKYNCKDISNVVNQIKKYMEK
jgi:hypothetical protein